MHVSCPPRRDPGNSTQCAALRVCVRSAALALLFRVRHRRLATATRGIAHTTDHLPTRPHAGTYAPTPRQTHVPSSLTLIMAGSHSDQISQWTLYRRQLCTQVSGSTSHGRPGLAVPPAHAAAAVVDSRATDRALCNMAACTAALARPRSSSAALRCLAVGLSGRTAG